MPHDEQPAVLAGLLDVLEGVVELPGVDAGLFVDLASIGERSPSAFYVGRRIVVLGPKGCEGQ